MSITIEINNTATGERRVAVIEKETVTIGRDDANDVALHSLTVSKEHLVMQSAEGGVLVQDRGLNPCMHGGKVLEKNRGSFVPTGSEVLLAEFSLRVLGLTEPRGAGTPDWLSKTIEKLIALQEELVTRQERAGAGERWPELRLRNEMEELIEATLKVRTKEGGDLLRCIGAAALQERVMQLLGGSVLRRDPHSKRIPSMEETLETHCGRLIESLGEDALGKISSLHALDPSRTSALLAAAGRLEEGLLQYLVRVHLDEELRAMVFGFGPLERLLRRTDVTEIMVVGKDRIYVERGGVIEPTGQRFPSDEVLTETIRRMISPIGRRVDRSRPLVDGRLKDGCRINAILPPASLCGPCLTIRKFPDRALTVQDLVRTGCLNDLALPYLRAFVQGRKSIVVSGGTGSGKTTLLNALASFIGPRERLVTVEDSAELRLQQPHVVTLESVPANLEGEGRISIRDLVINALRMRPDRIIVGECRGEEAADMLQAMNTGHAGSMTSLHANSAIDTMRRLEAMVLSAHDMPLRAIREQIASAIDIVVFIARTPRGSRRVMQISEVMEVDPDTGDVVLVDLFRVNGLPESAPLEPTGRLPSFAQELLDEGLLDLSALLIQS